MAFFDSIGIALKDLLPRGSSEALNDPVFLVIGSAVVTFIIKQWFAASAKFVSGWFEKYAIRFLDLTAVGGLSLLVNIAGYPGPALATFGAGAAFAIVARRRAWPTWMRWFSVLSALLVALIAVAAAQYARPQVNVYFVLSFDTHVPGDSRDAVVDAWKKFRHVLSESFVEISAVNVQPDGFNAQEFDQFSPDATKRERLVKNVKGRGGARPAVAFYTQIGVAESGGRRTLELYPRMYIGSDLVAHENLDFRIGPADDTDYLLCLIIAESLEKLSSNGAVKLSPDDERRAWTNLLRVFADVVGHSRQQDPALKAAIAQALMRPASPEAVNDLLKRYALRFDAEPIVKANAMAQQQAVEKRAESFK
jgi:hypothetical protein